MRIAKSAAVVSFLAMMVFFPGAASADVAGTYVAHLQANNIGDFCIWFEFDDQQYTPYGTPVNFYVAQELVCYGANDGTTVSVQCETYPDDSYLSFGGSGPAPSSSPPAIVGTELAFVLPAGANAVGSLATALGPDLAYLFDSTVVWGNPIPAETLPGCTIPTGTPGTMIANLDGRGAANVFAALTTNTGNTVVSTSVVHVDFDPGTDTYSTHTTPVDVTFTNVTSAGKTTIYTSSTLAGILDGNFSVSADGYNARFLDVATTAQSDPPIQICIEYDDANDDGFLDEAPTVDETRLDFFHAEGMDLDYRRCTSFRDTSANVICGSVDSLSPFVLAIAVDNDGDGVYGDDNCQAIANADQTDTDGDGVGDACDGCPQDASKLELGICGCGLADVDSDGDTLPDCDDPCSNSGDQDIVIAPKLMLKKVGTDETPGNDGLLIKGEFESSIDFSALDPVSNGARVVLEGSGDTIADVTIPGGAGWVAKGTSKVQFTDKTGSNNGITKIQIQDRSKKAAGRIKVQVVGKNGNYPVNEGTDQLRAIVVVGDGQAGECGETAFAPGQCGFSGSGSTIKCP